LSLDDTEVSRVYQRMGALAGSGSQFERSLQLGIGIILPMVLLATFGLRFAFSAFGLGMIGWWLTLALVSPFALLLWRRIFSRAVVRPMRQALVDCGHPVCIGCGYLLEGVAGPRCPECGRRIGTPDICLQDNSP
jgi:hypothetical protein